MIKSKKGIVKIIGTESDLLSELEIIIISMLREGFTKEAINVTTRLAFEEYEENWERKNNVKDKR